MKTFYLILFNILISSVTNNFVWFALTFWVYLSTRSVFATGIIAGMYLAGTAISGVFLGGIVDHHKKKNSMIWSSITSLVLFIFALIMYSATSISYLADIGRIEIWIIILMLLTGVIAGNIKTIALPTLVTLLVSENMRDRANGLSGTIIGISFALCSVFSGFILAYFGMFWVISISIILTIATIIQLLLISIPEKINHHTELEKKSLDLKGTFKVVIAVPGLLGLVIFTTFNNFIGGVFMALMDAYGLTLVSVQIWGLMWGVLSFSFILGGIYIAKKGLGKNPLRSLFIANIIIWTTCIIFPIQASIVLLSIGILIWMFFFPFIEAAEQTIIQKVVPLERQGRVFGFAQSIEQAASPVTAFTIGPLAQFIFIPFMTTGAGVDLIGSWFGIGQGRGIALVFMAAGAIGLLATIFSMKTKTYQTLSHRYIYGKINTTTPDYHPKHM